MWLHSNKVISVIKKVDVFYMPIHCHDAYTFVCHFYSDWSFSKIR